MPARRVVNSRLALRGLSVTLFLLYALAHLGAAVTGWVEFAGEQRAHGEPAELLGPGGYGWTLLEQTLQNWQSEFLALGAVVALTAVLLHVGSKHSRDGQDEVQRRVESIQRRVEAMVASTPGR